jgi:hypothetical protein
MPSTAVSGEDAIHDNIHDWQRSPSTGYYGLDLRMFWKLKCQTRESVAELRSYTTLPSVTIQLSDRLRPSTRISGSACSESWDPNLGRSSGDSCWTTKLWYTDALDMEQDINVFRCIGRRDPTSRFWHQSSQSTNSHRTYVEVISQPFFTLDRIRFAKVWPLRWIGKVDHLLSEPTELFHSDMDLDTYDLLMEPGFGLFRSEYTCQSIFGSEKMERLFRRLELHLTKKYQWSLLMQQGDLLLQAGTR